MKWRRSAAPWDVFPSSPSPSYTPRCGAPLTPSASASTFTPAHRSQSPVSTSTMNAVMHAPLPAANRMHAGPSRQTPPVHLSRLQLPAQHRQRRSLPDIRSPGGSALRTEYACRHCRVRIAQRTSVLSWEFRGATGKAALFTDADNVALAKTSVMLMDSGAYRVQHAACAACGEPLGWKFVRASEEAEKWKEGYLVLELAALDEEVFPLTPLEELQLPATARASMFVRTGSALDRRQSMWSLASVDRQRPHGPRQRRDS